METKRHLIGDEECGKSRSKGEEQTGKPKISVGLTLPFDENIVGIRLLGQPYEGEDVATFV